MKKQLFRFLEELKEVEKVQRPLANAEARPLLNVVE